MDEPTSLIALAMAALLTIERVSARVMEWRRNGVGRSTSLRPTLNGERGALGNGAKAITLRLDQFDEKLTDVRDGQDKLWTKVNAVSDRCARLEGQLKRGP